MTKYIRIEAVFLTASSIYERKERQRLYNMLK